MSEDEGVLYLDCVVRYQFPVFSEVLDELQYLSRDL
jgi:hypothetical protein